MTECSHRRLTGEEFDAYFGDPMTNVTEAGDAALDTWTYVDALDEPDIGDPAPHGVSFVYRHPNERWDHIIIDTCAENVHLVVVVDREAEKIVGHHLLNLNKEYGLPEH